MQSVILSALCTLAHVPSIVLRFLPFKNVVTKKQKTYLGIIYTLFLILNIVMCLFVENRGGISVSMYKIMLLGFCVVLGAVNIIVIKGYVRENLFTFGLVAIVVLLLSSSAAFITEKIGYSSIQFGLIYTNLILAAMFAAFFVPLKMLMIKTISPFLNINSRDYWNTIWFIPICMFFASLFSIPMGEHISTFIQLISRLLVGLATLFICRSIAEDYRRLQEKEKMGRQIELQKDYYDTLTEKVSTEREARHNFKHQIAAMRSLLDSNDKEALADYLQEMESSAGSVSEIPYTGNAAADGVLYHYCSIAEKNNIKMEVRCMLKEVTLTDIELCSLLGNALENALTACCEYDGDRYITIASQTDNNMLMITIDNSFDGVLIKDGETILSKKRDNEEGIGLSSMRQICEKHGGTCNFTSDGNSFSAGFILYM